MAVRSQTGASFKEHTRCVPDVIMPHAAPGATARPCLLPASHAHGHGPEAAQTMMPDCCPQMKGMTPEAVCTVTVWPGVVFGVWKVTLLRVTVPLSEPVKM